MGASRGKLHDIPPLTSVEICAGGGGQAVGLHNAGFRHLALIEYDHHAVETLRTNVRKHNWPGWDSSRIGALKATDVKEFLRSDPLKALQLRHGELDLLAGGVPCPPFSLAGHRLGASDDRDLFPATLELVKRLAPRAVMIENVRGILEPPEVFINYRREIIETLDSLGYSMPKIDPGWPTASQDMAMRAVWRRLDAYSFGVPQLRPRAVLVAIRKDVLNSEGFSWPVCLKSPTPSVFDVLLDSMYQRCQEYWDKNSDGRPAKRNELTGKIVFEIWAQTARKASRDPNKRIAPTLVGGSRKHGGADLGPTRAKRAWAALGIDANGVANDPDDCVPHRDLFRPAGPMLTVEQAALLQGFPPTWTFQGGKTARYRQVGNAFPPPVAEAVGRAIAAALIPEQGEALVDKYEMENKKLPPSPHQQRQLSLLTRSTVSKSSSASGDHCSDLVGTSF